MNKRQAKKRYKKIHGYNPTLEDFEKSKEELASMEAVLIAMRMVGVTALEAADSMEEYFKQREVQELLECDKLLLGLNDT